MTQDEQTQVEQTSNDILRMLKRDLHKEEMVLACLTSVLGTAVAVLGKEEAQQWRLLGAVERGLRAVFVETLGARSARAGDKMDVNT